VLLLRLQVNSQEAQQRLLDKCQLMVGTVNRCQACNNRCLDSSQCQASSSHLTKATVACHLCRVTDSPCRASNQVKSKAMDSPCRASNQVKSKATDSPCRASNQVKFKVTDNQCKEAGKCHQLWHLANSHLPPSEATQTRFTNSKKQLLKQDQHLKANDI